MEKYVNEETLIKNETYNSLPEDLIICPICQLLMIEPVMCLSCMNHFCKNCTDSWNKKNKTCLNGCQDAVLKNEIEKNRLITKLKFKCIKGCGEEILFSDIKSHYDSNCLKKKENNKEKVKNKVYGKKDPNSKIIVLKIEEIIKLKKKNKIDNSSYLTSKNKQYLIYIIYSNYIRGYRSWKNFFNKYVSQKKILFLIRFLEGESSDKTMNTLTTVCGADQSYRAFQLWDGSIINCMILDTAGQERFNSLSLSYYKKADVVLLVYDISNKSTFDKIKNYYVQKIKDNCKKDIPILLLGNKTDQENEREVSCEEGMALALKEKYEFKESSCLKNKNVAGAFESLIEKWNFENHKALQNKSKNNSVFDLELNLKTNLSERNIGKEKLDIKRT